jgi:hypothetical protein
MYASRRRLLIAAVFTAALGCGRDPLAEGPGGATVGTGGNGGRPGGGDETPGAGGAGGRDAGAGTALDADRREAGLDFRPGEVAIVILPGDGPPLPVGQNLQLRAVVDLGAGARDITQDADLVWRVDDARIAQVAERSGRLTATAPGQTTVHALHPLLGLGSAPVAVTEAQVRQLTIAPVQVRLNVGQSEQLQARASYQDGSEADVTSAARWLSGDQRFVKVGTGLEPAGRVTGLRSGQTVVSAEFAGIRSEAPILVSGDDVTTLAISPASARGMVGVMVVFQSFARRTGGAAIDVSGQSAWASSAPAVAASMGGGRFRCSSAGRVTVTATHFSIVATATLECGTGPMQIQELRLTSANSDFFAGLSYRLSVQAFYADGSPPRELMNNQVRWLVTAGAENASVDAAGVLFARMAGTVTVSATFGDVTGQETYTIKSR